MSRQWAKTAKKASFTYNQKWMRCTDPLLKRDWLCLCREICCSSTNCPNQDFYGIVKLWDKILQSRRLFSLLRWRTLYPLPWSSVLTCQLVMQCFDCSFNPFLALLVWFRWKTRHLDHVCSLLAPRYVDNAYSITVLRLKFLLRKDSEHRISSCRKQTRCYRAASTLTWRTKGNLLQPLTETLLNYPRSTVTSNPINK